MAKIRLFLLYKKRHEQISGISAQSLSNIAVAFPAMVILLMFVLFNQELEVYYLFSSTGKYLSI